MTGKSTNVTCAKCGSSSIEDSSVMFHRFPLPSKKHGPLRAKVWAKFCFPNGDWNSEEYLKSLYSQHKMLCSKHFDDSSYTSSDRKRMNKFAIPSEAQSILAHLREEVKSSGNGLKIEECTVQNEIQVMNDDTQNEMDFAVESSFSEVEVHLRSNSGEKIISELYSIENYKNVFSARGLMPPVFTPLTDDLTVNYAAIPGYAKFLASNGIKSVLVGGTTGEHMSLSVADRKKVVDSWIAAAKTTGLHIQVQVGGAPLADVLDLAAYCQAVGADSLLTLPELYFKPASVQDLVSYVELVAKAAPNLPVLYYHIPSMSKVEINMPAFVSAATARIPNFKGIKFTSNDLAEGAQVLRALADGQEMFLGADALIAPAALLGIKSSIGTSFNLFPKLAQDILKAVENNDIVTARKLQEKLSLAIEAHTVEGPWVPIMKAGMEIATGIKVGPPSLPQRPLSAEAKLRIKGKLINLGLLC